MWVRIGLPAHANFMQNEYVACMQWLCMQRFPTITDRRRRPDTPRPLHVPQAVLNSPLHQRATHTPASDPPPQRACCSTVAQDERVPLIWKSPFLNAWRPTSTVQLLSSDLWTLQFEPSPVNCGLSSALLGIWTDSRPNGKRPAKSCFRERA